MRISIGCDHGGLGLKEHLVAFINSLGHEVTDRGTFSRDSVDYPDYAQAVARDLQSKSADLGVLICTTGIGVSIAANKQPGIRAAVVHNEDGARYARLHNHANVICFGEKYDAAYLACRHLEIFLSTEEEGGRHDRRVQKIEASSEASPA
ncbi:MAG: ribose 5-phosphate isomerase B [Opitutales bacterium]